MAPDSAATLDVFVCARKKVLNKQAIIKIVITIRYSTAHAQGAEFSISHTFSIRKAIILLGKRMGEKLLSNPYTIRS